MTAAVDPEHAAQLTRDEVTASVHYVRFVLDETQREAFGRGPVTMAFTHPAYSYDVELSGETRRRCWQIGRRTDSAGSSGPPVTTRRSRPSMLQLIVTNH